MLFRNNSVRLLRHYVSNNKAVQSNIFTHQYKFSNLHSDFTEKKQESERLIHIKKELSVFNEFKEGQNLQQQRKYVPAIEAFKRVLEILEASHLKGSDPHIYLLKNIANNELLLRNYSSAEKYMEVIVSDVNNLTDVAQKLSHLNNLLPLYTKINPHKAITLAQILISEDRQVGLTGDVLTSVKFNIGTAYLLSGEYEKAEKLFQECLFEAHFNTLKGFTLNNLALALWWNPIKARENEADPTKIINYFKDSISSIENYSSSAKVNNELLSELLSLDSIAPKNTDKLNPDTQLLIKNKASNKPLLNLTRYLIASQPDNKNDITFWLRYAMKTFENDDPENISKPLTVLASHYASLKQFIRAEGLFRGAIDQLENKPDSYDKVVCQKLYGEMLSQITNRGNEGKTYISNAENLGKNFPAWAEKLDYVFLSENEL